MKVVNIAGFPVQFEKGGKTYSVPYDNQPHVIPDACFYEDNFQGLLRVIVPPVPVKKVVAKMEEPVDIDDPTVKEVVIEKSKPKPLAGKKLKPSIRAKLRKTRNTGRKKKVTAEE